MRPKILRWYLGLISLCWIVLSTAQPIKNDKTISLNFQHSPLRSVLQVLAQVSGQDMIISDKVSGYVTLNLQNTTWSKALAVILQTQGLAQHNINGVIMIAPLAQLHELETAELESQQQLENLAPLESEIFHINYGQAQHYYELLQGNRGSSKQTGVTGLLSARGRVVVDQRTNTLFVDDTAGALANIRQFIIHTDVAARQVVIEARIVSVAKTFERDLGLNFNLTRHGDLSQGGFNMDFGGATTVNRGNLNLQFARLPADFLLDLELSALESENDADIIANPRVITANNAQATIEQGQQIPYTAQAASGGTITQFVKATLKLDVTPQITPDNKIVLKLIVTQDVPSELINGNIMINTKRVETNILIDDGATIVLGGIYERSKSNIENRVPFLSAIPVLGNLFKATNVKDKRNELLIFVTPKIVDEKLQT